MLRMIQATALLSLLVTAHNATLAQSVHPLRSDKDVVDVAVDFADDGRLSGSLVAGDQRMAEQTVWLYGHDGGRWHAKTDEKGAFSFSLPRGGAYSLSWASPSHSATMICRVWPTKQAPPVAIKQVLLSSQNAYTVRGQSFESYTSGGCDSCGQSGYPGGFQNCDSDCGAPPRLSNCRKGAACCGCGECGGAGGAIGGGAGGRSKLLLGLLGGAVIGFALDEDDGAIQAEVGS